MNELDTVLYVDCTKLGVLSQVSINALGELAERLLFRNPSRYSLLITVAVFNLCCPVRILVFGSKKSQLASIKLPRKCPGADSTVACGD